MILQRVAILVLLCTSAFAQSDPIGIAECDAFIAAYQTCARSPGVPDNLKAAIQQGVDSLTTSLRGQANRGGGRNGIAQQCTAMHASVRANVVSVFKCDFPVTAAVTAYEEAEKKKAEPPTPAQALANRETAKTNAYTGVQNRIVDFYNFNKWLNTFVEENKLILSGVKTSSSFQFVMPVSNVDRLLEQLRVVTTMPGSIPDVDPAAMKFQAALERLEPLVSMLSRYEKTRAYLDDNFKLAREKSPELVNALKDTSIAAENFTAVLFSWEMVRDEARVAKMPPDSLAQRLTVVSLAARRAIMANDTVNRANTAAFSTALTALATANTGLSELLRSLKPPADSDCSGYADRIDTMTGTGRDLLRAFRGAASVSNTSNAFISAFNSAVNNLNGCKRDEPRASVVEK